MPTPESRAEQAAARDWYGYGRWNAPYDVIGPEPGMKKDEGDNLAARIAAWQNLGGEELLDCVAHHEKFGHTKWHRRTTKMQRSVGGQNLRPPTQPTWRQLIRLLLAFKGERTDNDAIGGYQASRYGSREGEVCAVELSALAARSLAVPRDRKTFREMRTRRLHDRIVENTPKFVIMYGGGKTLAPWWNIVATGFDSPDLFTTYSIAGWEADFATVDETIFVRAAHPTNIGAAAPPNEYWIEIGRRLNQTMCTNNALSRTKRDETFWAAAKFGAASVHVHVDGYQDLLTNTRRSCTSVSPRAADRAPMRKTGQARDACPAAPRVRARRP